MQTAVPLACFLSVIRPPGVQYENSLLQIAPVDKSKCPYMKDGNDVAFQLFTRHNPTVFQELRVGDDEKLFASNIDFHDKTVLYFHAWMETPEDGSGVMVREAYMQRGDTNVIMVDARTLQAGPWYFTAAQNTWYIGRFAGQFVDYLVTRGLNLNNTHFVGHSLGAHVAGVAGSSLESGKVSRITGLDAALPLFEHLPLQQRLDPSDAKFVDTIHTDSGIFGYKAPLGHVDFYPNAGISPQPGCELEVVIPQQMLLNKCDARTQTNGFYTYYLQGKGQSAFKRNSLEYKLEKLFNYIQTVRAKSGKNDSKVTLDKVKANIGSLYDFKDTIIDYLKVYDGVDHKIESREYDTEAVDAKDFNDNGEKPVKNSKHDEITDSAIINAYFKDNTNQVNDVNITEKNNYKSDYTVDVVAKKPIVDNIEQIIHQTTAGKAEQDQIAEESDVYVETDIKNNNDESVSKIENTQDVKLRKKRDTASNESGVADLTVVSGNLTVNKGFINIDEEYSVFNKTTEATIKAKEVSSAESKTIDATTKTNADIDWDDDFDISLEDNIKTDNQGIKKNKPKPYKFNLFKRRPILWQIIRILPRLNKRKQKSKFLDQLNKISNPKRYGNPLKKMSTDLASQFKTKFEPANTKRNVLRRQKRFSLFRREEDSNNVLFKMLDFLVKNRKNVLPVFTVMREINTLVKSGNGELNHVSRESNNYIGATPPTFTPVTYNLELGNENRVMAFVKRLFGVIPKGDRLSITGK